MLGQAATLPGALDGVKYYMIPSWERLADATVGTPDTADLLFGQDENTLGYPELHSY